MIPVRPVHILAAILLILSAVLAIDAIAPSINPYLTVSEVTGNQAYLHRPVQILATVADWTYDPGGAMLLRITDGNATMAVTYGGVPPQGLLAGQKIVVIGEMTGPGELNASQLLVKCPSKYG